MEGVRDSDYCVFRVRGFYNHTIIALGYDIDKGTVTVCFSLIVTVHLSLS